MAGERSNIAQEQFAGSTVGERSNFSQMAQDAVSGLGMKDYRQQAESFLGATLGGDFMGQAKNPHLDKMFDQLGGKVTEHFNRNISPGINSQFGSAGRSGSPGHGLSMGAAQGQLADSLGDIGTQIYYGDYENRMRDRMTALGMAPQIQGLEYADIAQQRAQGGIEEDYTQRLLNDAIQRFNFGQQEPENRLDRFGQRVNKGNGFGMTTGTQSGGGDGGASLGLGIASLLATTAGTFFGGPGGGAAAGGLVNGLGGGFGSQSFANSVLPIPKLTY